MENLIGNIKKGLKFELIDESIAGFQGRYIGEFLEYRDDCFIISIPKMNEREYTFKRDEVINIHVYTADGIYHIESKVLNFGDDYCKISLPIVMRHSQRREFLRADLNLKAVIDYRNNEYEPKTLEIETVNVCGRGICFNSKEDISRAKDMSVEIILQDRIVESKAEVVYSKPIQEPNGMVFLTALVLTSISDQNINALVRECFLYKLKNDVENHS